MDPIVIVLAAGRGERFRAYGGRTDKLSSLLAGRRVRDHVLDAVRASGLAWHIVEREDTAHLTAPGMGDSIACGVRATPHAAGWLILPADLPLIEAATLRAVALSLRQGPSQGVVVPHYKGERGHPVGFSAGCGPELMALTGDEGARKVMQAHAHFALAVEDPGCVLDVDTVERLAQAEALFHSRLRGRGESQ